MVYRKLVALIEIPAQHFFMLKQWLFSFCSLVLEMGQRESTCAVVSETDVQYIANVVDEVVMVVLKWNGPGGE